MKKTGKNKFTYWFDNQMAGGTPALIKMLTLVSVAAVIILGILVAAFGLKSGFNLGMGLWLSLIHLLDPGTVGGNELDNIPFVLGMIVITFIGLFLTSTLTGIICNAIDEKVQDLRRGKSVVVEKGHVIVLGTASGLYTIISELIEANSNHPREALVIMDNKDPKDVMDEKINARFPDKKTTKIICRSGNITDSNDLAVCSFDTCMSVIINTDSDALTLKCILAVTSTLKQCQNTDAYITAIIRDEQNKEAAELAGEDYVEILSYNDVMSRIIAHTGRHAGLSLVYTDLFDMDGSEFYIEEHPDAAGKTLSELNRYFPVSIVAGFVKPDGEILLNPEPELTAEKGDRLILFAEDDGESHMDERPAAIQEELILKEYKKEPFKKLDMLFLGYSDKLWRIITEEDHYVAPGSKMTIALPEEQGYHAQEFENMVFENIILEIKICDIYVRDVLESLVVPGMKVLVLAEEREDLTEEEMEKRDSRILLVLLQLRYLSEKKGYHLDVTSEMLKAENQEVVAFADVNDFVVSRNLTSLIVTQICQARELKMIFEELLREKGSEIYVRSAGNYIKTNQKITVYTACEAAARQREVLIGYRIFDHETGEMEIVTNPPKAQEVVFTEHDSFIVIAMD